MSRRPLAEIASLGPPGDQMHFIGDCDDCGIAMAIDVLPTTDQGELLCAHCRALKYDSAARFTIPACVCHPGRQCPDADPSPYAATGADALQIDMFS